MLASRLDWGKGRGINRGNLTILSLSIINETDHPQKKGSYYRHLNIRVNVYLLSRSCLNIG